MAEVLDLPVFSRGRLELLSGADLDRRAVRWVHTSEIYEIGPLLKGGEVLLTTGLGLAGCSSAALEQYVCELADRGVALVLLELGRTFAAVPPALVAAARRCGLPLGVLHGVVPFVEVTEAVHQLLLTGELAQLRHTERVHAVLTNALLSGQGLGGLLACLAELTGCQAALVSADGHVVAASDGAPDGWTSGGPDRGRQPVEVYGLDWGHLELSGASNGVRRIVLERAAEAVAIELARGGVAAPARREAASWLLRDLAAARFHTAAELDQRAALVGFQLLPGHEAVALVMRTDRSTPTRAALAAARDAARRTFRSVLVADLGEEILLALEVRDVASGDGAGWLRERLELFAQRVDDELSHTSGGRVIAVTAGPVVPDPAALVRSFPVAREAAALAVRLGTRRRVLLVADLALPRLIARMLDDPEMDRFVDSQLGRLLDRDATTGGHLLPTLETYLACGLSKTAAATSLGIRRQTLYDRLGRIERILGGGSLTEHSRRTALELALVAHRLRAAAVTR